MFQRSHRFVWSNTADALSRDEQARYRLTLRAAWPQKLLVSMVAIGLLASCTPIFEKAAKLAAKRESDRTFKLYVAREESFRACLQQPGAICEYPERDPVDEGDRLDDSPFADQNTSSSVNSIAPDHSAWQFEAYTPVATEPSSSRFADDAVARASRDVGANAARAVLNDPFQRQLNLLFMASRDAQIEADEVESIQKAFADDTIEVSLDEGNAYRVDRVNLSISSQAIENYQNRIEEATLLDGWTALYEESLYADFGDVDAAQLTADRVRRAYIKSYFEAYFRSGKVVQLTVNADDIIAKIDEQLRDTLPGMPEEDYEELIGLQLGSLGLDADNNRVFGSLGETSFVTRDGASIQFPGFTASLGIGSSKVERNEMDYVAVGADLIRVLLHAIYDANQRIPAVSNATGGGITIDGSKSYALQVNDVDVVSEAQFQRITTRANQVEGVVAAGTGRLVRGVSVLSLNNESLATAIETAVGLSVRKQTEKLLYCWYACGFGGDGDGDASAMADYRATSSGKLLEINIRYEANFEASSEH